MARVNLNEKRAPVFTHEGAKAARIGAQDQLLRSVMSCLLWEDEHYEDGVEIAKRIAELAEKVRPQDLAAIAIRARTQFKLRHVPLLLLVKLAKTGSGTRILRDTIPHVIRRADELAEFVALYWKINGQDKPLSAQMKKGLRDAFANFGDFALAKYDRDGPVKLRDVAFLAHVKPKNREQGVTFAKLVNKTFYPTSTKSSGFKVKGKYRLKGEPKLETPDTWETNLSAGKDKKATFERLLREENLGYLALLRNLRNMQEAGVDRTLIVEALRARKSAQWVLPFRYVAAARVVPTFERAIDEALLKAIEEMPTMSGLTAVLVDVSDSMNAKLSAKSDMTRMDAGAALAAMFPGDVRMFTFSHRLVEVPARRGMAGVEAIKASQPHGGTELIAAVRKVNELINYDRIIVISDEQAHADRTNNRLPAPKGEGYMINVASAKNGIGYGPWTHVDGFSEAVFAYIRETEGR